jgi:hypothetical protein
MTRPFGPSDDRVDDDQITVEFKELGSHRSSRSVESAEMPLTLLVKQ